MDMQWFVVVYLAVVVVVVLIVTLGEGASRASCLGKAHHCLAVLPCSWAMWCLRSVCGDCAVRQVSALQFYLCDRPNPVLQIVYSLILGGGHWLYSETVFPLVPGPLVSGYHIHTGFATVVACFGLLCLCSTSDPGVVSEANAEQLCEVYSYGAAPVEEPKSCSTCKIPRPPRSKHCPVCGRCVARFDHHCGWINNCVGANNLRLFLMFLVANSFLCFYAVTVAYYAVKGDMVRHKVFTSVRIDYRTGKTIETFRDWNWLLRWLIVHHSFAMTLSLFIALMGLMLVGFLAYHMWLAAVNSTTYEQLKLGRQLKAMREVIDDHDSADESPAEERPQEGRDASRPPDDRGTGLFDRLVSCCEAWTGSVWCSPYDRGLRDNVAECLWPEAMVSLHRKAASDARKQQ